MHSWSTFSAQMNHGHIQIHKTHHDLDLGKPPPFLLYYSLCLAMGVAPKCHFVSRLLAGSLEILKIETPVTLEAHNFLCKPLIEVRFKAKL